MSVQFLRKSDALEESLDATTISPAVAHHIIPITAFGPKGTNEFDEFDHDAVNGRLTDAAKGTNGVRVAIQQAYEEIRRKSFNVNDEKNGIWLPGDELDSIKFDQALTKTKGWRKSFHRNFQTCRVGG